MLAGVAMMPDGLGPMLARAVCDEEHAALKLADLVAMVGAEAPARWAFAGSDATTASTLSRSGAQWRVWLRATGLAGGVERLLYQTNPGLCCLSPLPAGRLGRDAHRPAGRAGGGVARAGIGCNWARRRPTTTSPPSWPLNQAGLERLLAGVSGTPAQAIAARVAALARLQARFAADLGLPRLAAWMAAAAQPALETWRSRTMPAGLPARLAEVAGAGDLWR